MRSVLVFERYQDLCELCVEVLQQGGYSVRGVTTLGEALGAMAEALPNVVIFDSEDAEAVVDAIRARGAGRDVKLVLVSDPRGLEDHASTVGALCLRKPFSSKDLIASVERAKSLLRTVSVIGQRSAWPTA